MRKFTEQDISDVVNEFCPGPGGGPGECCMACDVWHELIASHDRRAKRAAAAESHRAELSHGRDQKAGSRSVSRSYRYVNSPPGTDLY